MFIFLASRLDQSLQFHDDVADDDLRSNHVTCVSLKIFIQYPYKARASKIYSNNLCIHVHKH